MTEWKEPVDESIIIYQGEEQWVHDDLDLDYVSKAGYDVAAILADGATAEVAYQPGDGTFYGLVFTPLAGLVSARPRNVDGENWGRHAIHGMPRAEDARDSDRDCFYDPSGYLLSWIDHGSYPIRLEGRGPRRLALEYVSEHWDVRGTSAISLVVLLRAISYHLDARVASR